MSNKKDAPKPIIIPTPNGPYLYITDFTPKQPMGPSNSRGENPANVAYAAFAAAASPRTSPFVTGPTGRSTLTIAKRRMGTWTNG